jgi:hypothetical protein
MAFFEIFMTINSKGNITGKLRMAIKDVLFAAFDAIPEFIVSTAENPTDPRSKLTVKRKLSVIRFPNTMLYIKNPINPMPTSNSVLYIIFEKIIAVGSAIE